MTAGPVESQSFVSCTRTFVSPSCTSMECKDHHRLLTPQFPYRSPRQASDDRRAYASEGATEHALSRHTRRPAFLRISIGVAEGCALRT